MSVTDKLMGISEKELQDYIDSESREAEIEAESDLYEESDFDDEPIREVIDIDKLLFKQPIISKSQGMSNSSGLFLESLVFKMQYCRFISASNWVRWNRLKQAEEDWEEVGV